MNCPECGKKMEVVVELTGGCGCFGHGDDSRCYCDSADVHVELHCPDQSEYCWVGKKWGKNRNQCKQKNLLVGELSDKDGIQRWLKDHYEPGPNANMIEVKDRSW